MDITSYLARIGDESRLEFLADTFNARAGVLETARDEESLAWSGVYRVLAIGIETALIRRRTGVAV